MSRATRHWGFLLSLDKGRRRWSLAAVALALLAAGAAIALVASAGWLITASALAGLAAAAGAAITLEIFAPGAAIRAFAVLRTVSRYGERLLAHEAIFRIMARLRQTLFARAARLPFAQLLTQRRASTQTRLMQDVQALENVHAGLLLPTLSAVIATLGLALVAGLLAGPGFALLVSLLLASLALACTAWAQLHQQRHLRYALHRQRNRRDLLHLLDSHRELYFADNNDQQLQRWLRREADNALAEHRLHRRAANGEALLQLLLSGALITALWLASRLLLSGHPSAPQLALLLIGLLALGGLWAGLARAWQQLPFTHAAIRRLLPPGGATPAGGAQPGRREGSHAGQSSTTWTLHQITLRRGIATRPLLRNQDLTLHPGDVLHLTGASGQGKSSIASLLCGLLPAESGEITFMGAPLETLPETERLARIALMPQDAPLLSATLRDNLTLANPEVDDRTLCAALSAVGLDDLLPDTDPETGLDTWVGLNGRALSGGETRRIALIRTLLQRSDAVILDEPWRGLDATTRARAAAWVRQQQRGRTLIILDHEVRERRDGDRELGLSGWLGGAS
ncbi:amino acid ABC transporter ATP-binding/permease protein [Isoalcanivorax indicus]|uniref:amino acid ABC transporter ATP-binding/permease protein n=1 Tax=Isoalcanivorax indicus TaxID=2202653 RepID=UPI000DBA35E8|nr:ATP-binding cassette domain-containing protein [Isoalcanivorax indicus]